ncbi:MAG TPA: hypothetical protein VER75_07845, partial [Thermoleophilaceae bacterium]|nr:hypothetical protein [Thermoleophilaceae bacterium]
MGALDPQVVEQAEGVIRHVVQQVRHPGGEPGHQAHYVWHGRVDLCRETGVAVVEADHVEAALGEALAQLQVPVDQLHPQAHHQQQRRIVRVADRLVGDLEPSDVRARLHHLPGSCTRVPETLTENLKLLVRRNSGSFPNSSSFAVWPLPKRQPLPKSWKRILPR